MEIKDWAELGLLLISLSTLLWRMATMTQKFEQIGAQQAEEITEIKTGLRKVTDILIELSKISGRIDRVEDRQMAQGKRLDQTETRLNRVIDIRLNQQP